MMRSIPTCAALHSLVFVASSALAVTFAPRVASAYTCIAEDCPVWCESAPYSLSVASPDLGDATTLAETRRGMDDWTRVSCSGLRTSYEGRTGATAGAGDGNSVVGWIESGWPHDSNAIGVTGPRWNPRTGCIGEADMVMNGVNYSWTTASGRGGNVNAYSIVLHEGGHYYGLGHSEDPSATMYFAYQGGIDEIGPDDRNGICTLYPGTGQPPADCSTTGCPSGQECVEGACQPVMGDGGVCDPCATSAECGGPNDLCLNYPSGGGFCGIRCGSSADCPRGSQCFNVGNGSQCVGVDSAGDPSCAAEPEPEPGCRADADCDDGEVCRGGECESAPPPVGSDPKELGEACSRNDECASNTCVATPGGSVCSESCDARRPTSCPEGFYCDRAAAGTCDTGVCIAGDPGRGDAGDTCAADTDCVSLSCNGGRCTVPCTPGEEGTCPGSLVCQTSGSGCGVCGEAGGVGAPCDVNEDCDARMCTQLPEGAPICTRRCTSDGDCPEGMTCDAMGTDRVCVPSDDPLPMPPPPPGETRDAGSVATDAGLPRRGEQDGRLTGGCAVSRTPGAGTPLAVGWMLIVAGLVVVRRRRR